MNLLEFIYSIFKVLCYCGTCIFSEFLFYKYYLSFKKNSDISLSDNIDLKFWKGN